MKKIWIICLMTVILCLGNCGVVQIIQIFRHGARYPSFIAQGDNSEEANKVRSQGELTSQGKNMQYVLGQQLKKRYWKTLFGNTPYEYTYNQSKIYVRSTNYNRTIESAQCQLLGWFEDLHPLTLTPKSFVFSLPPWKGIQKDPPTTNWTIFGLQASKYHPVPIHITKYGANIYDKGQFLLSTDFQNCPNQFQWVQSNYQSDLSASIKSNSQVIGAIKGLQQQLGYSVDMWSVYKYVDNYQSLKYLGLNYLKIFDNPSFEQTFKFINLISFIFRNFYTQNQIKTGTSDLIRQILFRMKNYIKNPNSQQIILYSGHDSSVAQILAAFSYLHGDCIYHQFINRNQQKSSVKSQNQKCFTQMTSFASNVIVELIEQQKSYFVKVLYNGQYIEMPFCKDIVCTFDSFQKWVNNWTINNVQDVCGLREQKGPEKLIIYIISGFCVVFMIIIFILSAKLIKMIKKQQKHQNLTEQQGNESS